MYLDYGFASSRVAALHAEASAYRLARAASRADRRPGRWTGRVLRLRAAWARALAGGRPATMAGFC